MKAKIASRVVPAVLATMVWACSGVPSHIIQPEEMAELMADLRVGDAVVNVNRVEFLDDSSKMKLKQSIFERHGVTSEQFDTSMVWYGHNLKKYMDVSDRTIEILEERLARAGNLIAEAEAMSVSGDSVDVWSAARFYTISQMSPSQFLTFSMSKDQNWENGDTYSWRAKFTNNAEGSKWGIVVEYADSTMELINADVSGDGWHELSFLADSLLEATRVYGYLQVTPRSTTRVLIDSLELVRGRVNRHRYNERYKQRTLRAPKTANASTPDTVTETPTPAPDNTVRPGGFRTATKNEPVKI